ncbi:hypothetical protein [Ensifer soli]|uniref:hypothetical protein n=1 Tax=Ciceribacter sp. sgz301302 TaxID=3342379 RepID=UPI0035B73BF7
MRITWKDSKGNEISGRIDAAAWPYIEALGIDKAARLFLILGGSWNYLPPRYGAVNGRRTKLSRAVGVQGIALMQASRLEPGHFRVPLAKEFLCRYLRSRGRSVNFIAARLRMTDTTVRECLKDDEARRVGLLALGGRFSRAKLKI